MRTKNKHFMRLYSILLTTGLVIGLSGCGNNSEVGNSTQESVQAVTEAETEDESREQAEQTEEETEKKDTSSNDSEEVSDSTSFIKKEDVQISQTYEDSSDGGHAIEADGETAEYSNIAVIKTGEADGDEADFYGENAAIFATNGATLTLDEITVDTDGTHANGVFSYGEGTTVNISDSYIYTKNNCSGGLMTTGGGTMNATNLTILTDGNSSAAIRSDRGGGTVNVTKGSYTTNGTGSPVIYSTADITVNDATLIDEGITGNQGKRIHRDVFDKNGHMSPELSK